MSFIRYAVSKYFYWLGIFATVITITAIIPINNSCIAKCIILLCFLLAFLVPLLESIFKRKFNLKTIGTKKQKKVPDREVYVPPYSHVYTCIMYCCGGSRRRYNQK